MFCATFVNLFLCSVLLTVKLVRTFPDQGQWVKSYTSVPYAYFGMHKSLYAGSTISLSVSCEPSNSVEKVEVKVGWILRQTSCFEDYLGSDIYTEETLRIYYSCPMTTNGFSKVRYLMSEPEVVECTSRIQLKFQNISFLTSAESSQKASTAGCIQDYPPELLSVTASENQNLDPSSNLPSAAGKQLPLQSNLLKPLKIRKKKDLKVTSLITDKHKSLNNEVVKNSTLVYMLTESAEHQLHNVVGNSSQDLGLPKIDTKHGSKLAVADIDGIYLFVLKIESLKSELINITVDVTMKGDYGYLSAADFPLLLFYGFMCGIYVLYAFAWLLVSALQWRDLLRIQFWIGAVIFLGLIEKAVFYAEYQSINSTGQSVQGAVLFAEILSSMKRTLARMLVIIVSLGFGMVKPRLGPTLHRVVAVGMVYFILSVIEGCLRVLKPKNDPSNQALMAGIPLAVTDSAICWWIFSSLMKTNRTLRLRRNLVKLSLYRHFTNTLIFAVLASVVYMVWSIHSHKLVTCITDWKELWVDEAYWHWLFSLVLLVIMILWRPTNNNQRYAFTPLLDAIDDENEEDFDQGMTNDAFDGMKMRSLKNQSNASPKQNDVKNNQPSQDDDLKWVEENIPSTLPEAALPSLLDSDEEIMTAKFERSKME